MLIFPQIFSCKPTDCLGMPSNSKNYCGVLEDKFSKHLLRSYEIARWEMFQSCWKLSNFIVYICSDNLCSVVKIQINFWNYLINIYKLIFDTLKYNLSVEILWKYLTT